jgi:hypothetical protein
MRETICSPRIIFLIKRFYCFLIIFHILASFVVDYFI